jgi:alpha-L-rhamnosidase
MLYRYRGDLECAKMALPSLLRYIKYLTTRMDDRGLLEFGLGDWCSPANRFFPVNQYRGPLVVTDSLITMEICERTAFLFDKVGDKENAEFCANIAASIKEAVRKHLINFETMTAYGVGTATPGSQTSQAMAIAYGIFTEEEKPEAVKVLVRKLKEEHDHIDTGVLGARVIFHVLSENGYADYAYKVMTDPVFPSYGEVARRGDTAFPEAFMPLDYSHGVPSLNHHFFGDVSAWFIKAIAGINVNPDANNIHYVKIAPHFIADLTHAEAYHIAPDGKIEVKWERSGENEITLTAVIPENMSFDLELCDGWTVKEKKGNTYIITK